MTKKPTAPTQLVVRMADRLHRYSDERRSKTVAAAKARLNGKHPRAKDSAIVAAFGG